MSAHNIMRQLDQAREAGYASIRDPGAGGTVQVSPFFGMGTLLIETTGARTLQAAAQVPLGTRVLIFVTASGVTVNSVSVADGGFVEFIRGVDASGVAEWETVDVTSLQTQITANDVDIAAVEAEVDALQTLPVNAQTGTTYSLQASDAGKIVTLNNASAVTVTVPDALVAGFQCKLIQLGAGLVTVVGGGSMVVNTESAALTLNAQHGAAELVVYATNAANFHTYDISGT